MTREFLHEVVKQRERFTIPQPTAYRSITDTLQSTYSRLYGGGPMPYINGATVVSATPRPVPSGGQPHHIEIPSRARTATVNIGQLGTTVNEEMALEFRFMNDERTYHRTNTIIGSIPSTMSGSMREARMLSLHAYALVENHGCYPDYNVTGTTYTNNELFAISYACAHCGTRFSGVE